VIIRSGFAASTAGLMAGLGLLVSPSAYASAVPHAAPATSETTLADEVPGPLNFWPSSQVDLGGCSGSIVRFPTSLPTDSAMMLTAGHCIGRADGGEQELVDAAPAQSNPVRLLTGFGVQILPSIKLDRIMYAGNVGHHDLAVVRLADSFDTYWDTYRVKPLTIAASTAKVGQSVLITSGAWKWQTTCSVTFVDREDDQTVRVEPCLGIEGGWSGSPIINTDTREVLSVLSVSVGGGDIPEGRTEGPDASRLLDCVTPERTIDLQQAGCSYGPAEAQPAPTATPTPSRTAVRSTFSSLAK
jgi:hypothetical protein